MLFLYMEPGIIMASLLTTLLVSTILFGLAFAAMAIGLFVRDKILRGGCGSSVGPEPAGCDACSKKSLNLCDDEENMGLADPSFVGTMGRFSRKTK